MPKKIEMMDREFERLTVIEKAKTRKNYQAYWKCRCVCGNIVTVCGGNLRSGHTQSCGCLHTEKIKEKFTTHGMTYTPTYNTWTSMRRRCNNSNDHSYHRYGGRGITVCDQWENSFEAFLQDMGECPKGLTIERKNNELGYFKENCCWDSRTAQARNRRLRTDNKTGIAGITWRLDCQKYRVGISAKGQQYWLGQFDTIEQAVKVRKQAEQKYWKAEGI